MMIIVALENCKYKALAIIDFVSVKGQVECLKYVGHLPVKSFNIFNKKTAFCETRTERSVEVFRVKNVPPPCTPHPT